MQGKTNPVLLGLIVILVLGSLGVGMILISKSGVSSGEPLPATEYLESPKNFIGNSYVIDALIKEQVGYREGKGKIMEVSPVYSSDESLLVFISADSELNMHVGQRYRMLVNVDENGLLKVQKLEKY